MKWFLVYVMTVNGAPSTGTIAVASLDDCLTTAMFFMKISQDWKQAEAGADEFRVSCERGS